MMTVHSLSLRNCSVYGANFWPKHESLDQEASHPMHFVHKQWQKTIQSLWSHLSNFTYHEITWSFDFNLHFLREIYVCAIRICVYHHMVVVFINLRLEVKVLPLTEIHIKLNKRVWLALESRLKTMILTEQNAILWMELIRARLST